MIAYGFKYISLIQTVCTWFVLLCTIGGALCAKAPLSSSFAIQVMPYPACIATFNSTVVLEDHRRILENIFSFQGDLDAGFYRWKWGFEATCKSKNVDKVIGDHRESRSGAISNCQDKLFDKLSCRSSQTRKEIDEEDRKMFRLYCNPTASKYLEEFIAARDRALADTVDPPHHRKIGGNYVFGNDALFRYLGDDIKPVFRNVLVVHDHQQFGSEELLVASSTPEESTQASYSLLKLLQSANASIDVFMWKFDKFNPDKLYNDDACNAESPLTQLLITRYKAGVNVRVYVSSWDLLDLSMCDREVYANFLKMTKQCCRVLQLVRAGVEVRYFRATSNVGFTLFHPKLVIVDKLVASVGSFNWGDLRKRDFAIITTVVNETCWLALLFEHFWKFYSVPAAVGPMENFAVAPKAEISESSLWLSDNRPQSLFAPLDSGQVAPFFETVIKSANTSLSIFNPTLNSVKIADWLVAAAAKKVTVQLIISNLFDENNDAEKKLVAYLCKEKVQVRRRNDSHAKTIIVDSVNVFVGSTNFWDKALRGEVFNMWKQSSLEEIVNGVANVFDEDWNNATNECLKVAGESKSANRDEL